MRSIGVVAVVLPILALAPIAVAKPTKILAFGMKPSTSFVVRKNGGTPGIVGSSFRGSVVFQTDAVAGDRFSIANLVTTPVEPSAPVLSLGQNIPNPFNPSTRIPFTLDQRSRVLLRVYDVRGAHVATLIDENMVEGSHTAEWPGRDDRGRPVSSGVYFYALTASGQTVTRKMTLLK